MNTTHSQDDLKQHSNLVDNARYPTLIDGLEAGYFNGVTVAAVGERLRRRDITAVELVEQTLKDVDRLNPVLNAFVHIDREGALSQARAADQAFLEGRDAGPLQGIPVAIKDNIDTARMPTTYGSAHFADHRPERDADCVARLRTAGAIVIGKTLTHEFAYGPTGDRSLQGAARNPWNTHCMTGGSSAGSAAAVAAGLVPLAVGTDTGGSIRIPSALCGVVGFKPSFAAVSTAGVFPLSSSLDHVGPIAGHVEDCVLLFDALRRDTRSLQNQPRTDRPAETLRLGWIASGFGVIDEALCKQAFAFATALFGATPEAIYDLDPWADVFQTTFAALQRAEAYDVHAERIAAAPEKFEPEVLERLEASAETRGWQYIRAQKQQARLRNDVADLFGRYDLLLMPTLPIVAPAIDQRSVVIPGRTGNHTVPVRNAVLSLTSPWNVVGLPALTIPAGLLGGMPIGLQIIAAYGADDRLTDAVMRLLRVPSRVQPGWPG